MGSESLQATGASGQKTAAPPQFVVTKRLSQKKILKMLGGFLNKIKSCVF
jgi:hypothetical protein